MFRLVFRLAVFSALGALMLPGNEMHRDQAFRSVVAAYANAATYCDRYSKTCEQLVAQFHEARVAFADEAVGLSNSLAKPTRQQSLYQAGTIQPQPYRLQPSEAQPYRMRTYQPAPYRQ